MRSHWKTGYTSFAALMLALAWASPAKADLFQILEPAGCKKADNAKKNSVNTCTCIGPYWKNDKTKQTRMCKIQAGGPTWGEVVPKPPRGKPAPPPTKLPFVKPGDGDYPVVINPLPKFKCNLGVCPSKDNKGEPPSDLIGWSWNVFQFTEGTDNRPVQELIDKCCGLCKDMLPAYEDPAAVPNPPWERKEGCKVTVTKCGP